MSDGLLSILISVAILFVLFVWVPCLCFCDGCVKKIGTRRRNAGSTSSPAKPSMAAR